MPRYRHHLTSLVERGTRRNQTARARRGLDHDHRLAVLETRVRQFSVQVIDIVRMGSANL